MMPRRRHSVVVSALLGWGIVLALASENVRAEQQDHCGNSGVTVVYDDPVERNMACNALRDIIGYFRHIGLNIAPALSLRFADRAVGEAVLQGPAHGYFDATESAIIVYRISDVRPWGLPWTAQLAGSFLRHELAHMAIWQIIAGNGNRLRPEWHEFIAYAVQLDLMEPQLRNDLLAARSRVRPFADLWEINEFTSRMDPDWFAVAAYKTYLAKGGATFVGQLLRGEIIPPPFSYPFPVLPGQLPAQ